jgi:hypothetical protein
MPRLKSLSTSCGISWPGALGSREGLCVRCAVGSPAPSLVAYVTVTGAKEGGHLLRRAFMLPILSS